MYISALSVSSVVKIAIVIFAKEWSIPREVPVRLVAHSDFQLK